MADATTINTGNYWDVRFNTDWEAFEGPRQSRFFAELAIQHLPPWLLDQLRQHSLSLADWGCAQGDGTHVWADHIAAQQITGIDFSSVAINEAVSRYPAVRFISEDWLDETATSSEVFDIVFSSNTLEHFYQPYDVLSVLCNRARKAIVLALPFRETDRIAEHFFSFSPENLPATLSNGFRLAWAQVIDCSALPNTMWGGEQIFLVYAMPEWLAGMKLSLADHVVESNDYASAIDTQSKVFALRDSAVAERDSAVAERDSAVAERDSAVAERDRAVEERNHWFQHAESMRHSWSWRITGPLRFSLRLTRQGLGANDRRRFMFGVYQLYQRVPLPRKVRLGVTWVVAKLKTTQAVVRKELLSSIPFDSPAAALPAQQASLPDYVIWGVIDWHFRHQRPQQLAQALAAAGRRVFYISVNLVDDVRPGFLQEPLGNTGRLFQIRLFAQTPPAIYAAAPSPDVVAQLRSSIGELLSWADSQQLVSLVQHPFWSEIAKVLPNSRLVYDCMDHHEGFGNVANDLLALEYKLMQEAELTITTSDWLDQIVAKHTPRRALIRNAGEFAHFSHKPVNAYVDPAGRRIIGYYGAIAEWFDIGLVESIARQFADCCVLLIGADTVNAKGQLAHLSNVAMTGEMPYAELPKYLHGFDVCLLPFKVIPLTLATNPVKVYEYLSAGKPVVAVDLPEMRQFAGLVKVADNSAEFISAIADVLTNTDSAESIAQRQHFAQEQTWQHRASDLIRVVEDNVHDPVISVVVVTYNNLEFTRACLASLDEHSHYEKLEIIVVDNASADGSPAFLQEWATGATNRQLILNEDNRGFAAANNQGLEIATGDYLVMLNNDTYVTPGWVRTLVRHLERDKTIGLIGPVTNNIGNEAKIDIAYSNMDEMHLKSAAFTRHHIGQTFPLNTAAFFCVMMPRSTYKRVGTLDEAFGRGFFEDDDYCRRIEQLSLRVVCAEDVFVHHHLSASFNKLKSQDRQKLFEVNKATYEAKWGEWVPHSYKKVATK